VSRSFDGRLKVTGAARFVTDARQPGSLVGAVLTTSLPHSRVEVDVDSLRRRPGIVAALGPDDDPGVAFSTNPHGGTPDRVVFTRVGRFAGDVVGAVTATDRVALAAALRQPGIVKEEPLPAVTCAPGHIRMAASVANEQYLCNVIDAATAGVPWVEVEQALAASPQRYRSEVTLTPAPHGYFERIAAIARWTDDRLFVWSSTQCPTLVRAQLASIFDLDERAVIMESVYVGGGFGAKEELSLEPVAACLSRAAGGAPVVVELSREQCTRAYRTRHGGSIVVETGFDDDGRFLARWVDCVFEAGPYDGHSSGVARNALHTALRLYPRGAVGGMTTTLASNRTLGGAYRGYGATQASFACETHVDQIAAMIGKTPLALRRLNAACHNDGDPATGGQLERIRALDCLDELGRRLELSHEANPSTTRHRRGVGVALLVCTSAAVKPGEPDIAEVRCRLDAERGAIEVETAVVEAGQGIHSALASAIARELGIDPLRVTVGAPSGDEPLNDPGMFGSRGAHITCAAGVAAARKLHIEIVRACAASLGVEEALVEIDPDWRSARVSGRPVSLLRWNRFEAVGSFSTSDVALGYGAQGVEVDIDVATGAVRVERVVSIHDAGVVVNPDSARAQVEGGVLQGVGAALSERLTFDDCGVGRETGFLSHLMPTIVGRPSVEIGFLPPESAIPEGNGAKGIGEAPVMGIPAAVANAVADAVGVRVADYPLTPERVLRAIGEPPTVN
jgi:CO/xanthine dehydrogenase Mo-binding subunit